MLLAYTLDPKWEIRVYSPLTGLEFDEIDDVTVDFQECGSENLYTLTFHGEMEDAKALMEDLASCHAEVEGPFYTRY
jgi:hypothetical protein